MFNLFQRLKKIKTPEKLKPFMGELLLVREPEYGKPFDIPVERKTITEMGKAKMFEPQPYLPRPKVKWAPVSKEKAEEIAGGAFGFTGKMGIAKEPIKAITKKVISKIPKELEPLAKEARKYKSAEEFVKSQISTDYTSFYQSIRQIARKTINKPKIIDRTIIKQFGKDPTITLYRGINKVDLPSPFESNITSKIGRFWTPRRAHAEIFAARGKGGKMYQVKIKVSDLIKSRINRKTDLAQNEIRLSAKLQENAKQIKTKSQLTDIYTQATKGVKAVEPVVKIPKEKIISPAQKIINALKEAKPLQIKQEVLYAKARSQKFAKMLAMGKKITGEKGFYAEKGALKGEMPKVQFESIRKKIGQTDIDDLFNQVKNNPILNEWEKMPAREGLAKLLGGQGGRVPTKGELSLLKNVFGEEFNKAVLSNRTLLQKMTEAGLQIANIPRSVMASFDLSAPLRQGIFSMARHPKMFFSSFVKQFRTFGSEKAYKALNDEIIARPTYKVMRANKLSITELGSSLTTREEAFMSNWAEQIPLAGRVVRASGRAYTGFLNKFRADIFDDFIRQGKKLGIDDPKFLKSAASFVNHATGRGSLGAFEKAAIPLNSIFFSPRLIMSRLNLINPYYYATLQPAVRKEALKTLFTFAGLATSVGGLMKMGGAEVVIDPRNADFMKPKFGNVRYDILGGFQQPIRAAAQVISGKVISSTTGKTITMGEGYKPLTRIDIIARYFTYKESPLVSFAHSLLKGQTAIGEKVDIPTEVANRFTPMVIQDMYDLYREEGIVGIPMSFPAIFGVGVQSYGGVESYDLEGKKYPELNKELNRLKVSMGFPSTQAFGKELTNQEYKELRKLSGEIIADALTEIIQSEKYKIASDYEKKQLINKVVDRVKSKVKERLFIDKKVKNEIKKRLVKKGMDEEEAEKKAEEIYQKKVR